MHPGLQGIHPDVRKAAPRAWDQSVAQFVLETNQGFVPTAMLFCFSNAFRQA